ncbi:amino acid permease [Myxococcota bacterium]|nr:amino acid permease [Myxococcota bacterium]MBU1538075.1 amino acid permease [Myxococcota bacterium]
MSKDSQPKSKTSEERVSSTGWKASIGLGGALAIVVGSILGIGIFLSPNIVAQHVPNAHWFVAVWVIGGLMALSGALTYGELGSRYPMAGGDYVFLRAAYGKPVAFLSGWVALSATFSGSIAATAVGLAQYYIAPHLPAWFSEPMLTLGIIKISCMTITAIFLIWLFTVINVVGISFSTFVQSLVSFTPLAILAIAAIWSLAGDVTIGQAGGAITSSPQPTGSGLDSISIGHLGLAILPVFFAYSGWNAAAYIGSEIKNAERNLPLSLVLGIGIIILLYILLNALFLKGETIQSLRAVPNVMESAALKSFGAIGVPIFITLTGVAILGSLNSMTMTGPRIYHTMAHDGMLFRRVGKLSKKYGTPVNGLVFQAFWASLFVIMGGFEDILNYTTLMIMLFSGVTVIGLFVLRRRFPRVKPKFKVPLYPFVPLFYVIMAFSLVILLAVMDPKQMVGAIAITGLGLLLYYTIFLRNIKNGKTCLKRAGKLSSEIDFHSNKE